MMMMMMMIIIIIIEQQVVDAHECLRCYCVYVSYICER